MSFTLSDTLSHSPPPPAICSLPSMMQSQRTSYFVPLPSPSLTKRLFLIYPQNLNLELFRCPARSLPCRVAPYTVWPFSVFLAVPSLDKRVENSTRVSQWEATDHSITQSLSFPYSLLSGGERPQRKCHHTLVVLANVKPECAALLLTPARVGCGKSWQPCTLQIRLHSCQAMLAVLSISGQSCHPHNHHNDVTLAWGSLIILWAYTHAS